MNHNVIAWPEKSLLFSLRSKTNSNNANEILSAARCSLQLIICLSCQLILCYLQWLCSEMSLHLLAQWRLCFTKKCSSAVSFLKMLRSTSKPLVTMLKLDIPENPESVTCTKGSNWFMYLITFLKWYVEPFFFIICMYVCMCCMCRWALYQLTATLRLCRGMERLSQLNPGGCSLIEQQKEEQATQDSTTRGESYCVVGERTKDSYSK